MEGGFPAFCQSNLPLIYGLYGLAFFVTGVVVALESGRSSQLALTRVLPYLAGFGLAHGIHEWIDMFRLMTPAGTAPPLVIEAISGILLAVSFVMLVEFATRLMSGLEPKYAPLTRLTLILTALYLAGLLLYRIRFFDGNELLFWRFADILARYMLGVPGAVLAGAAMFVQRRAFILGGYAQFSRDLIGAVLAFAWYAAFQFVVPPAQFFPASALNTDSFEAYTGIPVQLFRAVVGALAAFFIVRVLRVFETEYARRIERLNRARFEAQEQSARELTVLFETCRILGTTLDLNLLLHDAIEKIVTLVEPVVAGTIFLFDAEEEALVARAQYQRADAVLAPDLNERARALAQRAYETRDLAYEAADRETAVLALPLLSGDKVMGAIGLAHAGPFSNLAVLQTLARQLVIAVENAQLYERVQEKEELRGELLERVVAAQEEERKRLARDLHDQTGQTLAGLAMGLHSVKTMMDNNPNMAGERLQELERMSAGAVDDLRQMIADLRPAQLDDLGLVPALREMANRAAERSQMQVEVNASEPRRRLRAEVETILYRLAQEALNNAARHSHARHVTITLKFSGEDVTLDIRDDGVGFVPEAVIKTQAPRRAWGLLGMQERVMLVGGTLDIRSAPGKGTRLLAHIPLVGVEETPVYATALGG
jgi:signal transduction histidine kinase